MLASTIPALALGFFLLLRLAGGALTSPLPAPQLFAAAFVLCIWAACLRLLSPADSASWLTLGLPLCVVLMFAIACSYPGTRLIDWLVWPAAIAILFTVTQLRSTAGPPRGPVHRGKQTTPAAPAIESEPDSQQILQQLTRYRDAEGRESVHGNLIAEFAPGERQTTLFVAFCPPFEHLPDVEVEIADDSSADVKAVQILHNGAQLDVRLPQPARSATSVTVEVFAAEPQSNHHP
jgi:hypothetical protein